MEYRFIVLTMTLFISSFILFKIKNKGILLPIYKFLSIGLLTSLFLFLKLTKTKPKRFNLNRDSSINN